MIVHTCTNTVPKYSIQNTGYKIQQPTANEYIAHTSTSIVPKYNKHNTTV